MEGPQVVRRYIMRGMQQAHESRHYFSPHQTQHLSMHQAGAQLLTNSAHCNSGLLFLQYASVNHRTTAGQSQNCLVPCSSHENIVPKNHSQVTASSTRSSYFNISRMWSLTKCRQPLSRTANVIRTLQPIFELVASTMTHLKKAPHAQDAPRPITPASIIQNTYNATSYHIKRKVRMCATMALTYTANFRTT